jgi:hypothetical protein
MKNQPSTRSVLIRDDAEAGKHRSSLTAFRHGITGHTMVMRSEDVVAYQTFTKGFFDDLKPHGILEEQFVQSLADTSWRLNRSAAIEINLFGRGLVENPEAPPLVIAKAIREKTRLLAALSAHGERLSCHLEETLKQFLKLREKRRHPQEKEDLTAGGFVFSNDDVEQAM